MRTPYLLSLFLSLALGQFVESSGVKWYTGEREHEGYPLQLRFTEKKSTEFQELNPVLVWVTHHFSKVTTSGMPESDYNEGLADFDQRLIDQIGGVVVIETFGGRRTYFGYVKADFDLDGMIQQIYSKFPEHQLKYGKKSDPDWSFLRRYSEDFKFYR